MQDSSSGFIIDVYNKYGHNDDVLYIFEINSNMYCIRRINRFDWGQPIFADKPIDDRFVKYYVYDSFLAAKDYVMHIKGLK